MEKLLKNLSSGSIQKLKQFSLQIQEELKPLEPIIQKQEAERLVELVRDYEYSKIDLFQLNKNLPIWKKIYNSENEYKTMGENTIISLSDLKEDWKDEVKTYVIKLVTDFKLKFVTDVIEYFENITKPLKEVIEIGVKISTEGFEAIYRFIFDDESCFSIHIKSVFLKGKGISATSFQNKVTFTDIILSNGEKIKFSIYNITTNFSV